MKITLCGSTKFMDLYHEANRRLTLAGHLVYSVAVSVHGDWKPTEEDKAKLDMVHLMKIDASDAILVVSDSTGYVGDSTRREIFYASLRGKHVYRTTSVGDRNALVMDWGSEIA